MSASNKQAGPGRPRKYATQEEADEARRKRNKEYQKKYLKVRRERYEKDAEYRRKCIKRSRKSYRDSTGSFEAKGFGGHAGNAAAFTVTRKMKIGSSTRSKKVLTIDKMAEVIGIVPKVLSGWIESNKFPRPTRSTVEGQRVFTVKEADGLARVLRDGLAGRSAFRATDNLVIIELHEKMTELNK